MANTWPEKLVLGQLKASQLPRQLDFAELHAGLADLCHRGLGVRPDRAQAFRPPGNSNSEWGACIVLNGGSLQLVDQIQGTPDGVAATCDPQQHNPHPYVGFAHIHLPDDTGQPYPGFSDRDYAATLADGDNLAIVCNGRQVFALVRSDCTQLRRQPAQSELSHWEHRYDTLICQHGLNAGLWKVNRELCGELGYAFYAGDWARPLDLVYRPWKGS